MEVMLCVFVVMLAVAGAPFVALFVYMVAVDTFAYRRRRQWVRRQRALVAQHRSHQ